MTMIPACMAALMLWANAANADPRISSWYTGNSSRYARLYASDEMPVRETR